VLLFAQLVNTRKLVYESAPSYPARQGAALQSGLGSGLGKTLHGAGDDDHTIQQGQPPEEAGHRIAESMASDSMMSVLSAITVDNALNEDAELGHIQEDEDVKMARESAYEQEQRDLRGHHRRMSSWGVMAGDISVGSFGRMARERTVTGDRSVLSGIGRVGPSGGTSVASGIGRNVGKREPSAISGLRDTS
jgi:hypothetical protein